MLKEDAASNRLMELIAWLDANRKQVLIGAAIFVAVAGGAILFFYQQSQREVRASQALSEVRVTLNTNGVPAPGSAETYLAVAKEHSGTKAAARAVVEAAGAYYAQGRYAEAQQQFERILREFPESPWQAEAAIGVAAALEAQGKTNEALAKYDELRKRYANSSVVDMAKLNTARLLEAQNKPADALKLYEELVKIAQMNPYNSLGNEAGLRMEELLEKHPELAKTNVPPPAVTQITPGQTGAVQTINLTNFSQPTATATNRVVTITNLQMPNTNISATGTNRPAPSPGAAATTQPSPAPAPVPPNTANK
jgi:tetratricopeptide (TPR) repeat protein